MEEEKDTTAVLRSTLKDAETLRPILDPSVRKTLVSTIKATAGFTSVLSMVLAVFLAILFGSQWNTKLYWSNLDVAVYCPDGSTACSTAFAVFRAGIPGLGYNLNFVVDNSFSSKSDAEDSVNSGRYHMVLFFPYSFAQGIQDFLNPAINNASSGMGYSYNQTAFAILDEGSNPIEAAVLRQVYLPLFSILNVRLSQDMLNQTKWSGVALSSFRDLRGFSAPAPFREDNLHFVSRNGASLATGFTFTMLFVCKCCFASDFGNVFS